MSLIHDRVDIETTTATDTIKQASQNPPETCMNTELEEEMRRALFGSVEVSAPVDPVITQQVMPEVAIPPPARAVPKKNAAKAFTPRLKVTLRVGNEFEGETQEIIHEADTLSTLLAEQEATKAAKKKYRYVEVISVKSM